MSKASKRERQRLNREARLEYEQSLARRRRMSRAARVLVPLVVIAVVAVVVLGGGGDDGKSAAVAAGCRNVTKSPAVKTQSFPTAPALTIDPAKTYQAVVDTNCGSFTMHLDAAQAPQTVNSFVFLATNGFYDQQKFHRVVKDFVIQGGDPGGTGSGGPGYRLPDEPPTAEYVNGSVAMANAGPGTSGSQFYVVTSDKAAAALNSQLTPDGKRSYSILGQVIGGRETIDKINKLGSTSKDVAKQAPKAIVVIDKITIPPPT